MKFQVLWLKLAEEQLASAWLTAANRDAIAAAADAIDAVLRMHPLDVGESREGRYRIMIEPPLSAIYKVSIEDRTVEVSLLAIHKSRDDR